MLIRKHVQCVPLACERLIVIRKFLIRIRSSAVIFVILGKICISKHADVDS